MKQQRVLSNLAAWLLRFGGLKKRIWRRWYEYLARRDAAGWTCMNYGYAGIPVPVICDVPSVGEAERWCLQLYFHVAEPGNLPDKEVLEVGSGRGGGAAFLAKKLQPLRYTGMDFSAAAVALCQAQHSHPGLCFVTGDAEGMPFSDAAFDAVINVESSHCYADFPQFTREVHRVLRPGGWFLHTDFRDADRMDEWRGQLLAAGFEMMRETDITPNVLAALAFDDARKRTLIQRIMPRWLAGPSRDFAGTKGSIIERAFASGEMGYRSFALRKAAPRS